MGLSHVLFGVWGRQPFVMAEHSTELPALWLSVRDVERLPVPGLKRWLSEHLAPGPFCADHVVNPEGLVHP